MFFLVKIFRQKRYRAIFRNLLIFAAAVGFSQICFAQFYIAQNVPQPINPQPVNPPTAFSSPISPSPQTVTYPAASLPDAAAGSTLPQVPTINGVTPMTTVSPMPTSSAPPTLGTPTLGTSSLGTLPPNPFQTPNSPIDIIYVPNEHGKLVPVLIGYSLSQIDALIQQSINPQEPLYSIQSLSANGKIANNTANLTIQMRIRTRNESIVRVPVGLQSGIFMPPPQEDFDEFMQYEGSGQCSVIANPDGKGYEILIKPKQSPILENPPPITHSPAVSPQPEEQNRNREITEKNDNPPKTPAPETPVPETPAPEKPAEPPITPPPSETKPPENPTENSTENPTPETPPLPADKPAKLKIVEEETPQQNENVKSEIENNIHTVTLHLSFPVTQISANEFQFKAEFPSALTSSLQLETPIPDAVVSSLQGGIAGQTTALNELSTLFVVRNLRNDFDIRWQKKQSGGIQTPVVLQVESSQITARLHSGGVSFDAEIPVRSFGGTFDSFRIRLPKNAVYQPSSATETTEYQIVEIKPENADHSHASQPQVLEIRLPQPTEGPVSVHFLAEIPASAAQDGWFDLSGFDLPDAEKQFGKLSVALPRETRLQSKDLKGIYAANVSPSKEEDMIVSGFEYNEQPYSLKVQAVRQAARIYLLRPEYQIQIDKNQAVLRAKYSYVIRGGKRDASINMNGWKWRGLSAESTVNNDDVSETKDGNVSFLLSESENIVFHAERNISDCRNADDEIAFAFPIPKADFSEPGIAVILPADNIKLTPLSDAEHKKIQGMTQKPRRGTPLQLELPPRRWQEPLVYLIDNPADALFCCQLFPQQQVISVRSRTEAALYANEPITQTLDYTVQYEPISRLTLMVPKDIFDDPRADIEIWLDSQKLNAVTIPSGTAEELENDLSPNNKTNSSDENPSTAKKRISNILLKQVMLPDTKNGTFQLRCTLPPPTEPAAKEGSQVYLDIPIILPKDGKLIQESVHVRLPQGLKISATPTDDEKWESELPEFAKSFADSEKTLSQRLPEMFYSAKEPSELLTLGVRQDNIKPLGGTTIEKGWLQTWLLPSGRVDHAVYRLNSRHEQLTLTLPEAVRNVKTLPVKVDGKRIDVPLENNHSLKIPLISENASQTPVSDFIFQKANETKSALNSETSKSRKTIFGTLEIEQRHTIELWYEVSEMTGANHFSLETPKFEDDVEVRPMYYQVMLPPSRHLLSLGSNFLSYNSEWIPQYRWTFQNCFFSRVSQIDPKELEDWIGLDEHSEEISVGLNSYLFCSLTPQIPCEINIADRSVIVLISSGIILLIGLIFIYFPKVRYSGIIFAAIVLFGAFFAYRVTITILFLQTGILGMVLVVLALFFYRIFGVGERRNYPPVIETSSAGSSAKTQLPPQKNISAETANVAANVAAGSSGSERVRVVVVPKDETVPQNTEQNVIDDQDKTQIYHPSEIPDPMSDLPQNLLDETKDREK